MTRFFIDYIALFVAVIAVYYLTDSMIAGTASGVFVGFYGFLCFKDGVQSAHKPTKDTP